MPAPEPSSYESALPEVCINGRFLSQRVTGVQRYARETLSCLDALLASGQGGFARWTLLLPLGVDAPTLRAIAVEHTGRRQGHAWEQIELARRARRALLFSFGFSGPLLLRRQVITVHDAALARVPQAFNWRYRLWYRTLVRRIAARAPITVVVSQFGRGEAVACYAVPPERVRVATEGWQHLQRVQPDNDVLDRHGLRNAPFALAVSSPTPSKNFSAIVHAHKLLGTDAPRFAVAGSADAKVFRSAGAEADSMTRLGYVSDAELKALYEHAACFVVPSFYEGFGIPPLEAMACGCPVLASTAPAIQEVCGDAALYFDPHQPQQLAEQLRRVFREPGLASRMAAAGHKRAQLYSWSKAARLNLDYIHEALAQR